MAVEVAECDMETEHRITLMIRPVSGGDVFMSEPTTKTEFAYRNIREAILKGELPAGGRLRLAEVAAQYGLSQMPVREAFRRLQADGLILINDHRGAVVAEMSWERTADYVAVRTYLEILAARESCRFHTDESRAELRGLIEEMRQATNAGDASAYSRLNREFHEKMYAPCRNSVLKAEINSLWDMIWREHTHSIFVEEPSRLHAATSEHEAILSALERQDPAAVEIAMAYHRDQTVGTWDRFRNASAGQTGKDKAIAD